MPFLPVSSRVQTLAYVLRSVDRDIAAASSPAQRQALVNVRVYVRGLHDALRLISGDIDATPGVSGAFPSVNLIRDFFTSVQNERREAYRSFAEKELTESKA